MQDRAIRPAFSRWPIVNRRLREAVAGLTVDQLAGGPGADRWPLWALVGHLACQRVFWLCDFAGEPGAPGDLLPRSAGGVREAPALRASAPSFDRRRRRRYDPAEAMVSAEAPLSF